MKKKLLSLLLSLIAVVSVCSISAIPAGAANYYSKDVSVVAAVKSYKATLYAKVTTTKLTVKTTYESKAKYLVSVAYATRSDKNSSGNYKVDMQDSTLTNVTGETASVSVGVSGSVKYTKGKGQHLIETTSDDLNLIYTVTPT